MEVIKEVWAWISAFTTEYVISPVKTIGWLDAVDIILLAVILCSLYCFCRNRRAGRVLLGLALVIVFVVAVELIGLPALQYLSHLFSASAFFCIVVIFQPEIRDALEHLGNSSLLNPRSQTISRKKLSFAREVVEETADAVFKMAGEKTGALIVFEGLTKLGDYISTGKPVDAAITSHVLQNLFFKNAPLHDGALIIRNLRIHAASCVLPANRGNLDFGSMGTRHRAAVGVTEVSDALVVVVSEQTGVVSVAQNGKLLRDVDEKTLKDILMTYIAGNAYLRQKKANMRKDYLEMMDNIGKDSASDALKSKAAKSDKKNDKNADAAVEEVFFDGQDSSRQAEGSEQDL
ncbi:MAG: diadenylate cyclase CdaA [Clostridia bacterium]|nr:diadenylate cyclase CdaA [Clostridia bacterium]